MENPIRMDDLGVPLFLETPISGQIMIFHQPRFPSNMAMSHPQLLFGGNRSVREVAMKLDQNHMVHHFFKISCSTTTSFFLAPPKENACFYVFLPIHQNLSPFNIGTSPIRPKIPNQAFSTVRMAQSCTPPTEAFMELQSENSSKKNRDSFAGWRMVTGRQG